VSVVCCQVEVSSSSWSLVPCSPTECGVSECEREASIIRRPWSTRGCSVMEKKNQFFKLCVKYHVCMRNQFYWSCPHHKKF